MLTTIEELEQEIDKFHKNIKDSNELMNILKSVATLTKTQTDCFEVRTKVLQDELAKLPPELNDLFKKRIEDFVQVVHEEHITYQTSVAKLMDDYADKFVKAENALSKMPTFLDEQLQKDRAKNVADLKQIQEQYAADLTQTNEAFTKQLQIVIENIQAIPEEINDKSKQQYDTFLKELKKMMDEHSTQLSDTGKLVADISQQLESKYNAFVEKLEATNIDQLYKYCQDMNKSINMKLGLILGSVIIAVIISIVSLFF